MTEPTVPVRLPRRRAVRALLVPLLLALVVSAGHPGWIRHKVRRGDTLSELAVKYGTSVEALRELNNLPGNNLIIIGQTLKVGRVPTVTKKTQPAKLKRVTVRYTVRRNDSVIKIANHFSADPHWLARVNNLPRSMVIHPGQRLVVGSVFVRSTPKARSKTSRMAPPPRVSKAYARSLVVREAKRAGMDPALALAVAYNESGFQQHVVSSVGAVGVMQVMPTTGAWVAKYLVKRPLNLRKVEDNVVAGVHYLAMLLRMAKKDEAIAGYYQGLTSVRNRGMYDDTKAYVKNINILRRRFAG
jgi:LysM repeat protein